MQSHLSPWRSAPNLCISCSLAVRLETIETAAPPVAWPSLTWVSQSWWQAGWHNTVPLPYAYHLSWLPDPTYAGTHMLTYGMHCWAHAHVYCTAAHTLGSMCLFRHSHMCTCAYKEMQMRPHREGQSTGNPESCTKHMVWKLSLWVGEDVCACETEINYGGEQSSGRKLSWLSLLWNDSEVKRGGGGDCNELHTP